MSVRVGDVVEPMNDLTTFPVAYGKDVWLDKNKSSGTPDYATLQSMYNTGDLGGGGSSIQVDTMPTASAENVGKIVQYVGESGTYQKGHFYECVYVPLELATSPYKWMEVDHFRFNHVIYNSNTPPANSDYTVGDIVFYTGKTTDDFTSGHYYRALPSDNPENVYTFILGSTVFFSYTPFEFRLGFIVYPTGTGGEDHPYEITEISEEGITITPYGWTGEEQQFVSVYYRSEIRSWEDLGGGGGGNIFNGTMDEWNELTTEQKKEYDNLVTPDPTAEESLVDAVVNGNMNAVTSNAVYNAIHGLLSRDVSTKIADLNSALTPGIHEISSSTINSPIAEMYGMVLIFGNHTDKPSASNQWVYQLAVSTDSSYANSMWIRRAINPNSSAPTNWNDWQQIGNGGWTQVWTGNVSIPDWDGATQNLVTNLSLEKYNQVCLILGNSNGSRNPTRIVIDKVENFGGGFGSYHGSNSQYGVSWGFEVDFSNGIVRGTFLSYGWTFSNTLVKVLAR